MTASVTSLRQYRILRLLQAGQQASQQTVGLCQQMTQTCTSTIGIAESLADGLQDLHCSLGRALEQLSRCNQQSVEIFRAIESGDVAQMEQCRQSLLQDLK